MSDDWIIAPCGEARSLGDVVYRETSLSLRSALVGAEMADAAFANDYERMLESSLKLRWLIVEVYDPYYGCHSAGLLAELDAHVARLRGLIAGRGMMAS
jgi:hypothetical protein